MKSKTKKSKTGSKPELKSPVKQETLNPIANWGIIAGLLVLTFIAFYPMLQNQFTSWDDPVYITKNARIWTLNSENIRFIFTRPIALNYHPFTMLSLAINFSFSQLNPYGYLLTNLLLHLLNVVLVFWFVYLLSNKNVHVSTFTAIIFAIHPMHVESVAWAAERKDVLYTFFFVAALIIYMFYLENRKISFYFLTLLLTLFSMLSKPAAIILPFVLMAIDYYRQEKFELRSQLNKIPFFVLAVFFLYMTIQAQTTDNFVIGDFKKYSPPERILFAGYGVFAYLIKLFVPYQLSCFHPYPKSPGILVYSSPVFLIVVVACIYYFKEKRKLLLFGLLFYLINLILVLQFFSVGDAIIAERYTYVPYIGVCFVLGMLLFDRQYQLNKKIIWGLTSLISLFFAYQANARVRVWLDTETLWTDVIKKYPECDIGYYNRGTLYLEREEREKAMADLNKAISNGTNSKSFVNRGTLYLRLFRYEDALKDFNAAIKSNPAQVMAYLGLGNTYNGMNKYDESLTNFNTAIRLKPTLDAAYTGRGRVYLNLNKPEEALADANTAVSIKPGDDSYTFRADVYKAMQKYDDAIADYIKIENITHDVSIHNDIGNIYFNQKNYTKAIAEYTIVINRIPNNTIALSNRSASYLLNGQNTEAIPDIENAIRLEPKNARNYSILGAIYKKMGDNAKADAANEKFKQLNSGQ